MLKGKLWSQIVENLRDLNFEARDKTVRVKKLNESILTKAEVIEVREIICLEDESNRESGIIIKKVDKDEWKKLR
ncbi:MAG: hypothetical protein US68_C0005G0018 [Candidatus Shapirobacteria bacterium GW2011_GWE1_38_10]|uniref:Uncharacterized protein n=1 Tax=Candidatus Shapirobacteria bacterium GW2011_GWE1_38_10 TaxID=1618488 RepID=A0A0G0LCS6_9BACT|nr:MAG: hypothetical protein US46_C0001G0011 [Candidatus Shapirobacteria bacterium GW2011_GWF2_37_20]KKQ50451.1 MAG: hypothetical protein US68_C0005G0018 [Candidatus Shapirobacteria bacterium GW2011_GWE1_38_10]KKQ65107.1 MAG: hypothetical protein US85_C0001G0034 [Candidatus Shapirobacteria bacterium GW2011_GWF1_38_23]HBP50864.1 hypothetical protein [Candidatus Shapirobacteria bacterium]